MLIAPRCFRTEPTNDINGQFVSAENVSAKVLVLDNDRELVEMLAFALRRSGFEVLSAFDIGSALVQARRKPNIAIIDLNLGLENGLEFLGTLRARSPLPVIMLSARDAEDDIVRALEIGADDYLTKPFSYRELIARIRAHLRRAEPASMPGSGEPILQVGPIAVDWARRSVWVSGQPVELTVTEFRLMHCLAVNAGRVVPTAAILQQIWGYDDRNAGDVVRVTVHRLRRKLGDDASDPRLIHTVARVGFMLDPRRFRWMQACRRI